MTIVPNVLVAGILTIVVSLTLIVWAAALVQRKHGGIVLILLSITLLLVGGGVAPPILGMLAGVAGTGIHAPHRWWRAHLSVGVRRTLANLWPWAFGICVLNGVFLVIGSVVLASFFGLNSPDLFVVSFLLAIGLLLMTIFTGIAHDLQARESHAAA